MARRKGGRPLAATVRQCIFFNIPGFFIFVFVMMLHLPSHSEEPDVYNANHDPSKSSEVHGKGNPAQDDFDDFDDDNDEEEAERKRHEDGGDDEQIMLARHMERRTKVKDVCAGSNFPTELRNLSQIDLNYIFVEDKNKLLFCEIPHIASANIRRMMVFISGKNNYTDIEELRYLNVRSKSLTSVVPSLSTFAPKGVKYRLKNYKKFMFVRNPFERLLSAYRSKFGPKYNQYFSERYGREIIKMFRKNPTEEALTKADDVTFEEFVKYVINTTEVRPRVRHWDEFHTQCFPCLVNYDFIGKLETFQDDIDFILSQSGVEQRVLVANEYDTWGRTPTNEMMEESYGELSKKDLQQLRKIFGMDFSMFGYECNVCDPKSKHSEVR